MNTGARGVGGRGGPRLKPKHKKKTLKNGYLLMAKHCYDHFSTHLIRNYNQRLDSQALLPIFRADRMNPGQHSSTEQHCGGRSCTSLRRQLPEK